MNNWGMELQRVIITGVFLYMSVFVAASQYRYTDSDFSFNVWSYNNITLPYRETVITADDTHRKPVLVVYLHGGLKRGSDNARQMKEDAIYTIADYLYRSRINAFMIVPQCPDSLTWGVRTNETIKALVDEYVKKDKVDADRIYLMGGSMGGTGTWMMTSAYPDLFAAVMPVAGNPESADAVFVASTPVYAVMGADDDLMTVPPVSSFMEQLQKQGGEARLDVGEGWSHINTCTDSYTDKRLNWIFRHVRSSE